jgi:hypothetical protein
LHAGRSDHLGHAWADTANYYIDPYEAGNKVHFDVSVLPGRPQQRAWVWVPRTGLKA